MRIDKKLLQYSLYTTGTVLLIYLGITTINHIVGIFSVVSSILGTLVDLVTPFLFALVIAYLLQPGVQGIENLLTKRNIFSQVASRRIVGIIMMYTLVISVFLALLIGIYVMVGGKLSNNTSVVAVTDYLMDYVKKSTLSVNAVSEKLQSLNIPIPGNLNEKIAQIVSNVQEYFYTVLGGTTNFLISIGSNTASFFIGAVLSIYLIKDSEYFASLWNKLFTLMFGNSTTGSKINEILWIIDDTFKKYIKGQLLEAAIVGVLSAAVLYIVGIDYALMIGIIAGICNMIPYIGPLAGTVLAVIMALLSGEPILALWAIVGMLGVQQVDNNLLAPKIIGDSVGLHPVFIMLAILIGGSLGGLVGMLTAVPVAASAKILLSKWYYYHINKSVS